ncbi:MAG: flagellar basal body rod protein FlgB [Peptococcaceae bacterium]|nr:flagellar basal body rod protein FlgB [Peptococcaceae bacterium]
MDLFRFDMPIVNSLERGLDYSSLRTKVLQHNIANIDTPNFKRSDLNFEALLNQAMGNNGLLALRESHDAHLQGASLQSNLIYQDKSTSTRNDNNNVDPDVEMTRLAENTYTYMYLSRAMTSYLNIYRQTYAT